MALSRCLDEALAYALWGERLDCKVQHHEANESADSNVPLPCGTKPDLALERAATGT
jgi:hypothetical protein